jgi:hypothetical protein
MKQMAAFVGCYCFKTSAQFKRELNPREQLKLERYPDGRRLREDSDLLQVVCGIDQLYVPVSSEFPMRLITSFPSALSVEFFMMFSQSRRVSFFSLSVHADCRRGLNSDLIFKT